MWDHLPLVALTDSRFAVDLMDALDWLEGQTMAALAAAVPRAWR